MDTKENQFLKQNRETVRIINVQPMEKEYTVEPVEVKPMPVYEFVKRAFDIIASLLAGVVLLLPMLLVALIIQLDSKGPVLYKQERLGKNGKPFYICKFRSMREDAEKNGAQWAEAEDDRCTRVGRILRKSRIDELPQLWNIFVGHMSIVGPRPERPMFYEQFERYIHGFSHRLAVKPGLTGLAQVNGGYDLLPEEKVVWDMRYIKERSAILDLKCILKTVSLVFTHKGAR